MADDPKQILEGLRAGQARAGGVLPNAYDAANARFPEPPPEAPAGVKNADMERLASQRAKQLADAKASMEATATQRVTPTPGAAPAPMNGQASQGFRDYFKNEWSARNQPMKLPSLPTLQTAAKVVNNPVTRFAAKGAAPAAAVLDAVDVGAVALDDQIKQARPYATGEEVARKAGKWGAAGVGAKLGGTTGAALGAMTGPAAPVAAPILGAVGALGGGLAGYFGAGKLMDTASGVQDPSAEIAQRKTATEPFLDKLKAFQKAEQELPGQPGASATPATPAAPPMSEEQLTAANTRTALNLPGNVSDATALEADRRGLQGAVREYGQGTGIVGGRDAKGRMNLVGLDPKNYDAAGEKAKADAASADFWRIQNNVDAINAQNGGVGVQQTGLDAMPAPGSVGYALWQQGQPKKPEYLAQAESSLRDALKTRGGTVSQQNAQNTLIGSLMHTLQGASGQQAEADRATAHNQVQRDIAAGNNQTTLAAAKSAAQTQAAEHAMTRQMQLYQWGQLQRNSDREFARETANDQRAAQTKQAEQARQAQGDMTKRYEDAARDEKGQVNGPKLAMLQRIGDRIKPDPKLSADANAQRALDHAQLEVTLNGLGQHVLSQEKDSGLAGPTTWKTRPRTVDDARRGIILGDNVYYSPETGQVISERDVANLQPNEQRAFYERMGK